MGLKDELLVTVMRLEDELEAAEDYRAAELRAAELEAAAERAELEAEADRAAAAAEASQYDPPGRIVHCEAYRRVAAEGR
jgi:regulator of protease activity HflC (stomatin/prohibitin superfamily)